MVSIKTTASPVFTSDPSSTRYLITVPGIGDTMLDEPPSPTDTPAVGAGVGVATAGRAATGLGGGAARAWVKAGGGGDWGRNLFGGAGMAATPTESSECGSTSTRNSSSSTHTVKDRRPLARGPASLPCDTNLPSLASFISLSSSFTSSSVLGLTETGISSIPYFTSETASLWKGTVHRLVYPLGSWLSPPHPFLPFPSRRPARPPDGPSRESGPWDSP